MNSALTLADIQPDMLALMIPIVALMIPIVAMLVKHQQRMAEIIHGSHGERSTSELAQLRQEVADLRQLVLKQTIALDTYNDSQRRSIDVSRERRLEEV